MTGQERNYEAVLSHVLHTTTDQLEPVGDGLTKIRERLSEPWLKRQWWLLRSEFIVLHWLVVVRCEPLLSTLRSRSAAMKDRAGALLGTAPDEAAGPDSDGGPLRSLLSISTVVSGKRPHRPVGPAVAWFRPALAVAGAVVLVVAGVFALGSIRATVVGLENATGTSTSNSGPGTGNGNPQGGGAQLPGSAGQSQGHSGAPSSGMSAARNKTVPSPGPCVSASPPPASPSPSPAQTSPSPTPSPTSPSPTPSPTSPTPTPSNSQAPITGVAGDTQEVIGTTALVTCEPTPGAMASPSNQATAVP